MVSKTHFLRILFFSILLFLNTNLAHSQIVTDRHVQSELFSKLGDKEFSTLCRGKVSIQWLQWGRSLFSAGNLGAISYTKKGELVGFVSYSFGTSSYEEEIEDDSASCFPWSTKPKKKSLVIDTICVKELRNPPKVAIAATLIRALKKSVIKSTDLNQIFVITKQAPLVRRLLSEKFNESEAPTAYFWNRPSSHDTELGSI